LGCRQHERRAATTGRGAGAAASFFEHASSVTDAGAKRKRETAARGRRAGKATMPMGLLGASLDDAGGPGRFTITPTGDSDEQGKPQRPANDERTCRNMQSSIRSLTSNDELHSNTHLYLNVKVN
jgi:hypothetical protein